MSLLGYRAIVGDSRARRAAMDRAAGVTRPCSQIRVVEVGAFIGGRAGAANDQAAVFTSSASGVEVVQGAASPAIATPSTSAAGAVALAGVATPTIAAPSIVAAGLAIDDGAASVAIGSFAPIAGGITVASGAASVAIGAAQIAAVGVNVATGVATPAIAAIVSNADGTVTGSGDGGEMQHHSDRYERDGVDFCPFCHGLRLSFGIHRP